MLWWSFDMECNVGRFIRAYVIGSATESYILGIIGGVSWQNKFFIVSRLPDRVYLAAQA